MTYLDAISLLGGLAFFLYGMHVMSTSLEKMAGGKLESILKKWTDSPLKGLILGIVITVAMQSSSATTVMLVGLVNSGIVTLPQTVSVMLGSNIGTTLTSWLLSLTSIDSNGSLIMDLIKPTTFSPIIALIGIILIMLPDKRKRHDIGAVLVGFAILMYGMSAMSGSVSGLSDSPEFQSILTKFEMPILGLLVSTAFTGVIQSSAATVGIIQALSITGTMNYAIALPLIMGANIGTCATALISSIGTNKNAKRVAAVHIYFKIIGSIVCVGAMYLLMFVTPDLYDSLLRGNIITPLGIAIAHSIFNVFTTVLVYPMRGAVVKFAKLTIKDKKLKRGYVLLDDRLLNTPSVAVNECLTAVIEMAKLTRNTLRNSMEMLDNYTDDGERQIREAEIQIDDYEDKLGTFLVKLSSHELPIETSRSVALLLHSIGDIERIGDHAVNILNVAKEKYDKNAAFSEKAKADVDVIQAALTEILDITVEALEKSDVDLAKQIEPLEEVIDGLNYDIKSRHIFRLQSGECTIELGFILSDLLTNYERVSDHCSNIAVSLIQVSNPAVGNHEYTNDLKYAEGGNKFFKEQFNRYRWKYSLQPERSEIEAPAAPETAAAPETEAVPV